MASVITTHAAAEQLCNDLSPATLGAAAQSRCGGVSVPGLERGAGLGRAGKFRALRNAMARSRRTRQRAALPHPDTAQWHRPHCDERSDGARGFRQRLVTAPWARNLVLRGTPGRSGWPRGLRCRLDPALALWTQHLLQDTWEQDVILQTNVHGQVVGQCRKLLARGFHFRVHVGGRCPRPQHFADVL